MVTFEEDNDSIEEIDMTSIANVSHRPLVSVIMNCLNCSQYLREAIASVYGQTYPNWEIIFFDNASSDSSSEIAHSFDHRLRSFRGPQTVPLGQARNLALAEAKGEFLAFLDCDDLWLPTKLEHQLPLFSDPEVGLVYCDSIYFNGRGQEHRLYENKTPYRGWCFDQLLTNYLLSMESVVIRRNALETLDRWFDSRFEVIEEYDLFVRLGRYWKVDFVPEPLSKWRVHQASWTWKRPHLFLDERRMMLRDLESQPSLVEKHGATLKIMRNQNALNTAVRLWRDGRRREARHELSSLDDWNIKATLIALASFFPAQWVDMVRSKVGFILRP